MLLSVRSESTETVAQKIRLVNVVFTFRHHKKTEHVYSQPQNNKSISPTSSGCLIFGLMLLFCLNVLRYVMQL